MTSASPAVHPPSAESVANRADPAEHANPANTPLDADGTPIEAAMGDDDDGDADGANGLRDDASPIIDIPLLLGEATQADLLTPLVLPTSDASPAAATLQALQTPPALMDHWRPLEQLQAAAARLASEHALSDYQARLADNSRRAQWGDLRVFAQYVLTAARSGPGAATTATPATTTANTGANAPLDAAAAASASRADERLDQENQRQVTNLLGTPDAGAAPVVSDVSDEGDEEKEPDAALVVAYATHLLHTPTAWADLRYGVVVGFVRWQLAAGYAIQSINRRLSTVKTFTQIAVQAGALAEEHARVIATVRGIGHTEGRHLDAQRSPARRGRKKAQPVAIPLELARRLKYDHPATPQGRRDAVLMCLLLDHGLRCSEVVELQVEDFALEGGPTDARMRFYRRKVDLVQTHRLTVDTYLALARYLTSDRAALGAAPPAPPSPNHVGPDLDDAEGPADPAGEQAQDRDGLSHVTVVDEETEAATESGQGTATPDAAVQREPADDAAGHLVGDEVPHGPLLCGSRRGGRLTHVGMRANALSARVRALGAQIAVHGRRPLATLSPHDCRHYWATMAFRAGADVKAVQVAGGWSSAAMPMLYALAAEIANEGIVLPR